MQLAGEAGIGAALLDRLCLDESRVAGIAEAVRRIASLGDPAAE